MKAARLLFTIILLALSLKMAAEDYQPSKHSVFASVGDGWLDEGILSSKSSDMGYRGIHNGFLVHVGYDYQFKKNMAIGGLIENYNLSKSSNISEHPETPTKARINLTYIAPQFSYSFPIQDVKNLRANFRIGTGYVLCSESVRTQGIPGFVENHTTPGWGLNINIELEWRLSQKFGITASVGCDILHYKEIYETEDFRMTEWVAAEPLTMLLGVKYHF